MEESNKTNSKSPPSSSGFTLGGFVSTGCVTVFSWLGVYLLGYFDFSVAWILTPLLLNLVTDQWKNEKRNKLAAAKEAALTNEQSMIESRIKPEDLPSWVFFPDKERAEWINNILKQIWPNVNEFVRKTLFETVEPAVRTSLEGYKLRGFKFEKDRVYLGHIPPRITGIKVYDSKMMSRNEIIMDLDIVFASDMEIVFSVRPITAKFCDFSLRGMIRVVLKPLISSIPLIGGVQVYFLTRPQIDFELGGVASAINIPAFRTIIDRIVNEQVGNLIVLPNKFTMPLVKTIPTKVLKCPDTAGVLRVKLHSAKDLVASDFSIMGNGKSDPYGLLTVGATLHNVPIRKCTLNPSWELEYDFPIEVVHGQQLILELFDDDKGSDDEFLGRATVQTSVVAERGMIEKTWIDLEGCKSGKVELTLSWLPITRDSSLVKKAAACGEPGNNSTNCLVHVYIDSINNLVCGKGNYRPTPVVQLLNPQNQGRKTWPKYLTNDPIIEQGFVLLVINPQLDSIKVRVLDSNKGDAEIAHTQIEIWPLIQEPDMEYASQPWILQGNSPDATIVMSASVSGLLPPAAGLPNNKVIVEKDCPENNEEDINHQLTTSHLAYDENVIEGKIKVVVHKAVNLEGKDVGGTSDPYAKIKYGSQKFKTDTVKKSISPEWEHELWISTSPDGDKQILFQVMDKDKIGKDQSLGYTTVDVRVISKQGKMLNIWERLQGCKTGRILISLEFYPENVTHLEEVATTATENTEDPLEVTDKVPSQSKQMIQQDENVRGVVGAKAQLENGDQMILKSNEQETNLPVISENEATTIQPEQQTKNEESTDNIEEVKESGPKKHNKINPGTLNVLVVRAEDLEKKDFSGKSDPYVKILYDGKTLKSKVVKKNLNPEFNYNTQWSIHDDGPTDIHMELFDHDDIGKDESLGYASFDLLNVINTPLEDVWINLEGAKSGRVLVKVTFERLEKTNKALQKDMPETQYGMLRMTIRFDEDKSELKVFVHKAKDLPGQDLPDLPDPFVKLCLMPGNKKIKKTKLVIDSCNPTFDEEFDFDIKLAKLVEHSIQATVMDKKGAFTKSSALGRLNIILDNPTISQGITGWFPLERPDVD